MPDVDSTLEGYCFYCGALVYKHTLTQLNQNSAYRVVYNHNCGIGELTQQNYPDQQQEKYSHANRNGR